MHPPNLAKGPLLATNWTKNAVFVGGCRGVRFKKSTFWVRKVHFWGFCSSADSILAMGLQEVILRATGPMLDLFVLNQMHFV